MTDHTHDNTTATDTLWGADAIARHIDRDLRQTYYLLANGKLPHKKLGPRLICASKKALDAALGRTPQRVRSNQGDA